MRNSNIVRLIGILAFAAIAAAAQDKARVERIIDGDTMEILWNSTTERVRLIGIDTPESHDNAKARRDSRRSKQSVDEIVALGKRAAEFVASLVKPGDLIRLEFDTEQRDRYSRLLAYVYTADGRMLNEVIVRSGYAGLMTIPPNVRYQARFLEAYRIAREEKLGLWSD